MKLLPFIFLMGLPLLGQVTINEISATSNDRIFTRDANGIAQLGGGIQWWQVAYDDSQWQTGTTPIGFGYGDISTNVSSAVRDITPTLYLRHEFNLTSGQASSGQTLSLQMDYDDSFIAYLNGKEIARQDAAAEGSPHYPDQPSYNSNTADGTGDTLNIGTANQYLLSGDNVLAIEVHNESLNSATLKAKATLKTSSTTYVNSGDSCAWFPGVISPSGGVFDYGFISGSSGLFAPWGAVGYDDSAWPSGPGPIGSENSTTAPYALGTNLQPQVQGTAFSVYMRTSFTLTQAQLDTLTQLELTVDYDDGYIAYLNGTEISRGTMGSPGEAYAHNQPSDGGHNASTDGGGTFNPDTIVIDSSLLKVGENILSGQSHNSGVGSSDLILYMELGDGATTFVPSNATYSYFVGTSEPAGGPASAPDLEVAFSDWIELHNPSGAAVDISGWGLSDDPAAPLKWTFPSGTSIAAGDYLLVHADDQEEFNGLGSALHAGFKLSASGEDVVLTDLSLNSVSIPGGYPTQYPTHSYGWDSGSSTWVYFETATPGVANSSVALSDRVDAADYLPKGGFYDSSQSVTLTSTTLEATIRYTIDGSEPSLSNGFTYSSPVSMNSLTNKTGRVLRTKVFKTGLIPSKGKFHTYLIGQASQLKTVPALIFSGNAGDIFFDDHGIMSIQGGTYVNNQWVENGPDSYNIPMKRGQQYERPLHLEFYHSDGSPGFREDGGIRLSSSGYSRPRLLLTDTASNPWASSPEQKPSFNLYFRDDYGAGSLDHPWLGTDYPATEFEQLRIRAGKNDIRNPWIVDEHVRRLFSKMGQEGSTGIVNTLYINGEFKGFFNMCERLREPFMQTHHGGNEDWDVRQVNDYANGDITVWNEMLSILNRSGNNDLSQADWEDALEIMDPVNMADYFLINIYGATWDWPQNNWVGARERTTDGKYRLYVWDAEGAFHSQGYFNPVSHNSFTADLLSKTDTLSTLFKGLMKAPEFRLIFADRINKHMFNDGVLDDRAGANSTIVETSTELRNTYQPLLSFVHGQSVQTSYLSNWVSPSVGRRRYLFGPSRTDFSDNDLWPSLAPPAFSQHGGEVQANYPLGITGSSGTIYYTLDGSDPRELGGAVSASAITYSSAPSLAQGTTVAKARIRNGSTWSALTEATFTVELTAPSASNLVISEFLYHPPNPSPDEIAAGFIDDDNFEFIELLNISSTETLDLKDLYFFGAMTFDFTASSDTELSPGERVIVAADTAAFTFRYGLRANVVGQFSGSLSNNMETVELSLGGDTPAAIRSFTYSDDSPWPVCADGPGHSLVLVSPNTNPNHNLASSWTCSAHFGGDLNGQPLLFDYARWSQDTFSASQLATIADVNADPDSDGVSNFLEFISGSSPLLNNGSSYIYPFISSVTSGVDTFPVLNFQRSAFDLPLTYTVQVSDALSGWADMDSADVTILPAVTKADLTRAESYRVDISTSAAPGKFYRIKFTPGP
ncbi:lamin tail domain-containing protein [bacterium]|nr:lamin tail domain-containing protein [Akkermansiaceae bacterium]MDC0315134.1 lamin tail domain-containing protein [bacterium]